MPWIPRSRFGPRADRYFVTSAALVADARIGIAFQASSVSDFAINLAIVASQAVDRFLAFEIGLRVNKDALAPIENLTTTPVSVDRGLPFEFQTRLGADFSLNVAIAASQAVDRLALLEILMLRGADATGPLEARGGIASDTVLPLELRSLLVSSPADAFSPIEITARQTIAHNPPLETVVGTRALSADNLLLFEIVSRLVADEAAPFETAGRLAFDGPGPLEFLGSMLSDGILRVEALATILIDSAIVLAMAQTIQAGGSLLAEALTRAVNSLMTPVEFSSTLPSVLIDGLAPFEIAGMARGALALPAEFSGAHGNASIIDAMLPLEVAPGPPFIGVQIIADLIR